MALDLDALAADRGSRRGQQPPGTRLGAAQILHPARRTHWLSGEAAAEWDRIVPELQALGVLAQVHRAVLVTYCTAWADYVDLYHAVQETGWTVPTGDGGFKRNPNAASLRDAHERLRSAASEFGMTPSALVRLANPGGPIDDPLEQLEKRRRELEKRRRNRA